MPPVRDAQGRFVKGSGQNKTTDTDLGFRRFAADARANARRPTYIDVGIFVEEVAIYALANEFGTLHIPSRSWMRNTVDTHRAKYLAMMERAGLRIGPGLSPADALVPIANEMRNDFINAIQSGIAPENAQSTVDQKGFNAPLVDTGQMQRALNWRIVT